MKKICFRSSVVFLISLSSAFGAPVEPSLSTGESSSTESTEIDVLPEVTVLGHVPGEHSPLEDILPTVSELSGKRLERKKQSTLGEMLSKEAGISSSFFGPNASRPVIRGLEGERVRVLQNGIGSMDASGASPDHAVSVDPLLIERVEIVRGSAALLYGNSAIGGVVNTVDGRIPERLTLGTNTKFYSQFSSVDKGRSGGAVLNHGVGNFMFHFDGVARGTSNYEVPGFVRSQRRRESTPLEEGEEEEKGRVRNSAAKTLDGSIGGSYHFKKGFVGTSFSAYDSHYGTVAEKDVSIEMRRKRLDVGAEILDLGFIRRAKLKTAYSYYKHEEFEGPEVGTTFRNKGVESRLELRHLPVGVAEGTFGFQHQLSKFSAIGDEAFMPTTHNSSAAAFFNEDFKLGDFTPSLGARLDRSGVRSEESSNFGAAESKNFWASSVSSGLLYKLDPQFSLGLTGTLNERAPNYQEIFANGPHVATGIYEVGDRSIGKEKSRALELSLRRRTESGSGRISTYTQDFSSFIALSPTGTSDETDGLPIYNYRPVRARLFGAEVEYRQEIPLSLFSGVWEIEGRIDWVRGQNRTDRENLPRITPMRQGLSLNFRREDFSARIEADRAEAQRFLAPSELKTDGYTMFNLGGEIPFRFSTSLLRVFARANNVFDVEARNHVSFLKDIAPLPGRNFVLGVQATL